ncbi:MAG TPA: 16S rRNA (cytosine(967)-C(5))-methyltransferase RsmB [Blastocatellia bacterium]|nr:16S rRNA (cytosine(967)-C(5))-methyltransferase RsmB [Blastocatellia bacterium]
MNRQASRPAVSPARRAAFDILRRVSTEGAYAAPLIAALPQTNLSSEDRRLAQELALGVLRWQSALDYFIERYSGRVIKKLDAAVLIALRLGLYQLRFLSRVPPAAAVNESVNLVKRARAASAAPMVNAVLRRAARQRDEQPGASLQDPLERFAVEIAHPRWLIEKWIAAFGEAETRRLAMANNQPPPIAFRVNLVRAAADEVTARLERAGLRLRPSLVAPGALVVEDGPAAALAQAAESGDIYIQDEASQLVSLLLAPQSGERILDLCAAPGSKSSHLATMAGADGWVMACDIHPHRLATLAATCKRLGIESVAPVALDATRELPLSDDAPLFDRVLIDAPCSGTGTLRRNPEIKWRRAASDIARLADVQLGLLVRATSALKRGGRLVYSTCSMEREENEAVIQRFLESGYQSQFRVLVPSAPAELITDEGFVRTFPHRDGADGFFAAVLEKTGEYESSDAR